MNPPERLEVEDEDERQERIGQLLKKVDRAGEKSSNVLEASVALPTNHVAGNSTQVSAETTTELLDRVRQFLPQLAESNTSLSNRDQRDLDIESIGVDNPHYIEMNLGLGVFEYGRQGASSDNESSTSASSLSSSPRENDKEGSDSDSDSLSSSEDAVQVTVLRPKKPLPRRAKPSVTVATETENSPNNASAD